MNSFNKILIANRGEIAVRVIRTAKDLGYRTVAVFSEADADALHVKLADQAVCIGAAAAGKSYLVADKILEAAQRSGADAIHPGYGFLSENADFARQCESAEITFIGPSPEAIELMGSKRLSKIAMLQAGVPCIPGYQGEDQSDETLSREANSIGFPVMVKASAGGGGRGMRLVLLASELPAALKAARSEAKNAFGSDQLILERAMIETRHIEIQVFADNQGNVVHLGERDCSIQRRHQKVIEESPSPFVDEDLRQRMGKAAVEAAKACNYSGAGTVEFLTDKDINFYFLEMNTRLQVEHPVTEMITGLDLVAWQLKVAAGERLPLQQEEIKLSGHAMEVRLYAEDPRHNFMPQTGDILRWELPSSSGIRIDHGICEGQRISSHYDPLLAKVIAHGTNREQARRRLACAVEDIVLLGVNNNKQFLANVLRHPAFVEGEITTGFIEQHYGFDNENRVDDKNSLEANNCGETDSLASPISSNTLGLAAIIMYSHSSLTSAHNPELTSWRNCGSAPWKYRLCSEGEVYQLTISVNRHDEHTRFTVVINDDVNAIDLVSIGPGKCVYIDNGLRQTIDYVFKDSVLYIESEFGNQGIENITHKPASSDNNIGNGQINASTDGVIIDVPVVLGELVKKGQTIAVLEAMKMEHQLIANVSGKIEKLTVKVGDQVKNRQSLALITPSEIES